MPPLLPPPAKKRFLRLALSASVFLAIAGLLFAQTSPAQESRNLAAEWPAWISGEFAFFRDYTFVEPAWTGVLFYNEGTWAAQVFFPESQKRITSFFTTESEGGTLVLTGQRNDPNLQPDDVPHVNYLMQILPVLWEARHGVETQGAEVRASEQSLFPPGASLEGNTSLFGGRCEFVFSPEIPLFSLSRVNDSAGRTVFAFESAGLVTQESSDAFFYFEPVPQEARQKLAEIHRPKGGQQGQRNSRRQATSANAETAEEIITVAQNFFLVGDTASVLVGSGETGDLSSEAFYAIIAKNFLLSGDASVLPVPETFACSSGAGGVWFDQILYMKDEKTPMRKRMLLRADFAAGKYSFAELSCFESSFEENKVYLERIVASLLPKE